MSMRALKAVFALGVAIGAVTVHASFELMYLPQPAVGRVLRYDPTVRATLGSFGVPGVTQVLYRSGQYGYVKTPAGPYRYDFFGGYAAGYVSTAATSINASGTDVFRVTGSVFAAGRNLVTLTETSITLGASAERYLPLQNGLSQSWFRSGTSLITSIHNASGTLLSTVTSSISVAADYLGVPISIVNRQGAVTSVIPFRKSGDTNWSIMRSVVSSDGAHSSSSALLGASSFDISQAIAVAPAHFGYYVVGADTTTPSSTRFAQFDNDSTGVQYDTWTESFDIRATVSSSTPFSVGMTVAPEPASILALALGGLVLARRRSAR